MNPAFRAWAYTLLAGHAFILFGVASMDFYACRMDRMPLVFGIFAVAYGTMCGAYAGMKFLTPWLTEPPVRIKGPPKWRL